MILLLVAMLLVAACGENGGYGCPDADALSAEELEAVRAEIGGSLREPLIHREPGFPCPSNAANTCVTPEARAYYLPKCETIVLPIGDDSSLRHEAKHHYWWVVDGDPDSKHEKPGWFA